MLWNSLFRVAFLKQSLNRLQVASTIVPKSQGVSGKGWGNVPLTEKVCFKTVFQIGNRVQIPKLVRWRYKLETDQILKVTLSVHNVWGAPEFSSKNGQRRKNSHTQADVGFAEG